MDDTSHSIKQKIPKKKTTSVDKNPSLARGIGFMISFGCFILYWNAKLFLVPVTCNGKNVNSE